MDEEQQRQFAENLKQLNDLMPGLITAMGAQTKAINDSLGIQTNASKTVKDATAARNTNTEATKQATQSTYKLTAAQQMEAEASKKAAEAQQNFAKAGGAAYQSLLSFKDALLSTEQSFGKYGGVLKGAGDAAFALGKAFGPLGTAAGFAVKGLTMVGEAALKQADDVLKAKDALAKMGGAGGMTGEELLSMAHRAGVTSKNLDVMIKPMQSLSGSMLMLGTSADSGMKAFGDMVAVSKEQRMSFQRLGMSQGDLMQAQADYIKLQKTSGASISNEVKDKAKLQKASLEYAENLITLSKITNEDIETIKKKQQELARANEFQIAQINLETRARKAEAAGRTEEAAKYRAEAANQRKILDSIATLGNKSIEKGIRGIIATGTIAGEDAQKLARLGLLEDAQKLQQAIKTGANAEEAAAKFKDAYNKKYPEMLLQVGRSAQYSKEVADAYAIEEDANEKFTERRNVNYQEQLKVEKEKIDKAKKEGKDPLEDARAKRVEAERSVQVGMDNLLKSINPLFGGFNLGTIAIGALTLAAGGATLALGKIALGAAGGAAGGVVGKVTQMLGGIKGPGGAAGGAGAGAMSTAAGALTRGKGPAGAVSGGGILSGGAIDSLGKLGGTMLKGIADGIAAFANPKVALGAVGLGAAITAIGAGIAGATWLLGKALPTMAEGMKSFEELDGPKLKETGSGMISIAGGLAAFGVGSALAGLGNIMGNVAEGVTKLFGGETPFDKLKKFSELDIDGNKVKTNAEALGEFGIAMAKAGVGIGGAGLGSLAGNIADGLGKLFGKKDAIDKFKDFAKMDVDPKKAKDLAEAFKAYAEGLGALGARPSRPPALPPAPPVPPAPPAPIPGMPPGAPSVPPGAPPVAGAAPPPSGRPPAGGMPPAPPGAAPPVKQDVKANLASVAESLKKRGITDQNYINAVLGNVMKESGGKVSSENLNYGGTSNQRIRKIFGERTSQFTDEQLNAIKKDPQQMAEMMYGGGTKIGKGMGNTEPGDGWKFRGRGYIQLTGKNNYAAASKAIFGDERLVENPDLVNDPSVASEVVAWYMQKGQSSMASKLGIDAKSGMSASQAQLLATSQIAGTAIKPGQGYLGGELLTKVASYSSQMGDIAGGSRAMAQFGGIMNGPSSGYPVDLMAHGKEAIVPLTPNSIIEKLSNLSVAEFKNEVENKAPPVVSNTNFDLGELVAVNMELRDMMETKLTAMIDKLDASVNLQDKLYKNSI